MNRREFLQTGSGVVAGMVLLNPRTAFGYEANSAVRHGLLGCGNRGSAVAESFARNTSARVVALADLFADNLAKGQDHFNKLNASLGQPAIDSKLLFRGPHAFEQVANSKDVDLIQISTSIISRPLLAPSNMSIEKSRSGSMSRRQSRRWRSQSA